MKLPKLLLCLLLCLIMSGCVDQSKSKGNSDTLSIAVTSTSIMEICRRMDIPLDGIPLSELVDIPEEYLTATIIGSPMAPDMEILSDLNPDWVLSPITLMSDLQPKYDAINLNYAFVNLKSVDGMYQSISDMGVLFDKEEQAQSLVDEYTAFMQNYESDVEGKDKPTVLLLMGLPGSYIVATENSYAGNLIELAGGENIYAGTGEEFLNINPEDMLLKNPDIILRTAHALPDEVVEMFKEEFETNDIWSHFSAVKENRVFDLPSDKFGMSANFNYQEGLEYLKDILYP